MKTMAINRHGPPNIFELSELAVPIPEEHELLVKVKYSSVNPLDCRIRSSTEIPRAFPLVLGYDVCGVVEKVGIKVEGFKIGDTVVASPNAFKQGANAEYIVIDSRATALVPEGINIQKAAVLPLAGLTALDSLYERAKVQEGQTVLIHAGAGGVGHLAIQLAKAAGCRVITTASRPESIDFCRCIGADEIINYKENDFVEAIHKLTNNKGCDASFDFVGEDVFNKSLDCTKVSGQVVTITPSRVLKGGTAFLAKNLTIHYEFMGVATAFGINIESQGAKLKKLIDMIRQDILNPHIGAVLPVKRLAEAHELMERGDFVGKILIDNRSW